MAKKSKKIKLNDDGFVFSTNASFEFDNDFEESETLAPQEQLLEVHLEKKGRGGKTAVIVRNFVGTNDDLADLAKLLKTRVGTGGSAKEGEIIIQGDVRNKVMEQLQKLGYKTKRVGG
jgi:translation initiation factor 1